MTKQEFLEAHIFQGLENLNDGFDIENTHCFSETEFNTVIDRSEKLGVGIYAIAPWHEGKLFGAKVNDDFRKKATDARWYKTAFFAFKREQKDMKYTATFRISEALLNKDISK
ncbi:MAG: hypothetical protein ACSHW7_00805 [Patiriisocius sp.]|uniref:hypothetical protein n=1 Tax=Patiriisocius sp. TaxID=2822396 RepID=UPI003EF414DC